MTVAAKDKEAAFAFYLWNCALGEAFYVPLHFCEIVCRNTLHLALRARLGDQWYGNQTFIKIMDPRHRRDLEKAIADERTKHGVLMTAHHVVSALTFGFWEHLTTKRFERLLWAKGARNVFPDIPKDKSREDLHGLIESVRRWRNRIAHHEAIFDKKPTRKHQDALELLKWACSDTAAWVQSVSRVPAVINLRPK